MSGTGLGAVLAFAAFGTLVMLFGILLSQLSAPFRNFRRMYEFGAAGLGLVFVALLGIAALAETVLPTLPIVVGVVFVMLGGVVFLAATRGRYFGSVSDYRIIGRALLIAVPPYSSSAWWCTAMTVQLAMVRRGVLPRRRPDRIPSPKGPHNIAMRRRSGSGMTPATPCAAVPSRRCGPRPCATRGRRAPVSAGCSARGWER